MNAWGVIAVMASVSYLFRVTGPLLLQPDSIPPTLDRILRYIAPAVLSGLVVAGIFATGRTLTVDARAAGLAAALVAAYLKAPALVVIVVAAGATALARAV